MRALVSPGVMRVARLAFLGATVGVSVYAVATRWHEVSGHLHQIGLLRAVVCVPPMLLGLFFGMHAWRAILSGLGSPLPVRVSSRVYFVGQLGKYLPGSIWPVLAQMELGHDHDVPRRRSAAALVIAIVVSLATGLIIAAVTIPFVDGGRYPALWWLLVPVPVLAALLSPHVLWACLRRLPLSRLGATLPPVLPNRAMAVAATWATLGWLSYGLHVAVLAAAFKGDSAATIAAIGGYALAWAAGLIAFVLPAGAGARDVALVLALSGVLATNAAIAVAVVSRTITTACDLALAVSAAWAGARLRRREGTKPTPVSAAAR
jgi:hypothetical protein